MENNTVYKILPIIRGLLAEPSGNEDVRYNRVILKFCSSISVVEFVNSKNNNNLNLCPIPLKNVKIPPLQLDSIDVNAPIENIKKQITIAMSSFIDKNNTKPKIVFLKDIGIIYIDNEPDSRFPLQNEVAIVTGAAGAIGSGICRGLLEKGCFVAATDLPGERLDKLVEELKKIAENHIFGIGMDITNTDSVANGFDEVSKVWGGVDIIIANAGIPLIASLDEMQLEDFQKLEKVNVEGTLLTLSEAGRHLRMQGTGGDIVIVSTKNVFAPGARFGAYSATKAAAHQLGRIASLELAEFDIRVNMVAPDAVFSDGNTKSGLWEKIGPDRMKHRGITDENKLQEYYQSRNLLKAKITARHVANAVLFFVTRQTPTTGATIPVDGGLPDATPR
ncbi:MAG: hypothetical protein A2474_04725 [Elusimicrobia bacterium RIFOXYC2_FULL_34_12]|nr:MAG: hypothetical protein A2474_04725 [Elusimicrobia bacterium RIFOXYC2_FULL_34_12]OGS39166.1 MAG: hypothetical protein A2551_05430 [Elusimicrobia bacterium RIFOXYD2_FULL_34_30]HAM38032.1 hypothetical protein [Elusimicrobiota bacterium]